MLSAKEALQKSNDYFSKLIEDELRIVENNVVEACSVGDTSAIVFICLCDKSIRHLEDLGYSIKIEPCIDSLSTKRSIISWDDK